MKKAQVTVQVLPSAGMPDGIEDGCTICTSGYSDSGDLLAVLDAAAADTVSAETGLF